MTNRPKILCPSCELGRLRLSTDQLAPESDKYTESKLEGGKPIYFDCKRLGASQSPPSHCAYYKGPLKPVDIVIVTAVKVEFDAVRKHLHPLGEKAWEIIFSPSNGDWHYCSYASPDDKDLNLRIALTKASGMGLSAASSITALAIQIFRPSYIVMLGITAGRERKTRMGDIMVPLQLWDYGAGKWTDDGHGGLVFRSRPDPHKPAGWIGRRCQTLHSKREDFVAMHNEWTKSHPADGPVPIPELCFEPMVSGAAVVDARQIWDNVFKQNDKVHAIDMEAYGVYQATYDAVAPRYDPVCLVAKSVCDHGIAKSDDPQSYAAFTSARFFRLFLEEMIIAIDMKSRPVRFYMDELD